MRIKFHRVESKKEESKFTANGDIKAPEVFLIDENGEAVGKVSTEKALAMAQEADLDLVLLNPKAQPPVAKITNLGQLKYEQDKKAHKQKMQQKKVEIKNVRLSFRISSHDLDLRLKQAEKFLSNDNKIKIELILRGRERQHQDKARELITNFVDRLRENEDLNIEIEQPLTKQGGRLIIVLINKK